MRFDIVIYSFMICFQYMIKKYNNIIAVDITASVSDCIANDVAQLNDSCNLLKSELSGKVAAQEEHIHSHLAESKVQVWFFINICTFDANLKYKLSNIERQVNAMENETQDLINEFQKHVSNMSLKTDKETGRTPERKQ